MGASPAIVRKLQASLNRVAIALDETEPLINTPVDNFDCEAARVWFARWESIRAELVSTEPELGDLEPHPTPDVTVNRNRVPRPPIVRLESDMRYAFEILTHPSRASAQVSLDREGIFVAGQPFDAMLAVTSILRSAAKDIVVVDGYVSEKTLGLLSVKADGVTARVLTKSKSAKPAFKEHARAFADQYAGLEVKTSDAFHDRFIVVDDTDFYHFGASIKDAARNTFMFSRIEEPAVIAAFTSAFGNAWAAAVPFAF